MDFLGIVGTKATHRSKPWITKYAPTTLTQIIGNPQIVKELSYYVANQNIPNLLLSGPHGCGKQTVINCLVNEYLGTYINTGLLTVYGSIDRGKDVVSERQDTLKKVDKNFEGTNIMNFIKRKIFIPDDLLKIIVIYDFDHMTKEAQMALRRIMELYSHKVRFILTCNDMENIIEAIQSRCVTLRFTHFAPDELKKLIINIITAEKMILSDDMIDIIVLMTNGDAKQAINYLQIINNAPTKDLATFYKIFNIPTFESILQLLLYCKNGKTSEAFTVLHRFIDDGYTSKDILDIMFKLILKYDAQGEPIFTSLERQNSCIMAINQCYYLVDSADSYTYMYSLLSKLIQINQGKNTSFYIY